MSRRPIERLLSHLRRLRFRTKIAISIIVILLVFGTILSLVIGRFVSKVILEEKQAKAVSLSVMVASRAVEPILSYDFLSLKDLIDETVRLNSDVTYAFILDKDGKVLVHTFVDGFPSGLIEANSLDGENTYKRQLIYTGTELIYDIAAPVAIVDKSIGTMRIGISHTQAEGVVRRLRWTIYLITAIGVISGALIAAWLSRTATQKINVLYSAAREVIKGNLDVHINKDTMMHCWQIMACARTECPAYGEEDKRCWYIAGTKCPECKGLDSSNKFDRCQGCVVYEMASGDEIQELADFLDVMLSVLKDRIDTLKRTEDSLQQQRQLLKMILDVTPDYVSLQDPSMRYIAVNKAFCSLVGKKEEEIIGKTDSDLLSIQQSEMNSKENQLVISTVSKRTGEFQMTFNDTTRWFHVVRMPVLNPNGEVTGVLCSSRDITEIRELHNRLAKAQHMESIGQLAAGVAHEINTPLGIILGYTQLMIEDAPQGTELHENLLVIEKYTRICKKIVSDLLHFSRQTESVKRELNINEILEQVIAVIEHTFSLDRVFIVKELSERLPLVYGDGDKLQQVFMNILRNAYDAIGSDGSIYVSTGFDNDSDSVVAVIADSGCGIAPENQERVFNPFFSTKSVGKGTGLGLSVSLGILQDHGGTIEFESPPFTVFPWMQKRYIPSKGTMFIIKIPPSRKGGVVSKV
jgi:PAS domain S-box-containing protein